MWDFLKFILEYLTKEAGIWGLLLFVAICWIGIREYRIWRKKDRTEPKPIELDLKEKQAIQSKLLKQNSDKITEININLENIIKMLENFDKINDNYDEKINILILQLQQSNEDRVEDLKEVLSNYNNTMGDIAKTLEKIKLILEYKLGD